MSAIVSELTEKRKPSEKAKGILKKSLEDHQLAQCGKAVGSVAFSAATGIPPIGLLSNLLDNQKVQSPIKKK